MLRRRTEHSSGRCWDGHPARARWRSPAGVPLSPPGGGSSVVEGVPGAVIGGGHDRPSRGSRTAGQLGRAAGLPQPRAFTGRLAESGRLDKKSALELGGRGLSRVLSAPVRKHFSREDYGSPCQARGVFGRDGDRRSGRWGTADRDAPGHQARPGTFRWVGAVAQAAGGARSGQGRRGPGGDVGAGRGLPVRHRDPAGRAGAVRAGAVRSDGVAAGHHPRPGRSEGAAGDRQGPPRPPAPEPGNWPTGTPPAAMA